MANNIFIDAHELTEQNDQLNYINYETISEEHKEFLRSDVWDFSFTSVPNAVYFPGMDLIHARMISVSPNFPVAIGQMQAVIRQFQIEQATVSGTTAGSLSMEFEDREDQAISAWLDDWRDKYGSREERYAFRKEDTIADGILTMMNSSRKPIRTYTIYTIQLQDEGASIGSPQFNSDDPQDNGRISATFMFEHYKLTWKNI